MHRDIKPSNLILDQSGHIWITDFGLAKIDEVEMTKTGEIVGTLRYMAPERFEGWSDRKTDIYSLGATLYELLCCRPIFEEKDSKALFAKILNDSPTSIRKLEPAIPEALETIVHKCLEKDPADRYHTCEDLRDDLIRFLNNEPIKARQNTAWEKLQLWCKRNPQIAGLSSAIAALTVFIIVGMTVAIFMLNNSLSRTTQAEQNERASRQRADEKMLESYLTQAQLAQQTRLEGRQFKSLENLELASNHILNAELTVSSDQRKVIENQVITSLATVDIAPVDYELQNWELGTVATRVTRDGTEYGVVQNNGRFELRDLRDHHSKSASKSG